MKFTNPEKIVKTGAILIVIYLLCFGVAMAFFPIRPFWNDEWRLMYNLKFKNVHQLWGTLDLLQQCPRVYLTMLKKITSYFDYSYTSMRLPALVITAISILFCFFLRKKIVPGNPIYSYLFILIIISSSTFTDYIVQVKQYEMDIFLSLAALWQLVVLLDICDEKPGGKYKYLLLCFSFAVAPFFSYEYVIAIAPVIPIIALRPILSLKNKKQKSSKIQFLLFLYLPLAIACTSILIFYFIDVKQLMADDKMYMSYWVALENKEHKNNFILDFWRLFSLVGSGAVFEIIFGILGIAAFFYGISRLVKTKLVNYTRENYIKLYAVLVLLLTLGLFLTDKLVGGGAARLTAYAVPSISLLIVFFITNIKARLSYVKPANVLTVILFLGLFGNIITTCINRFTYPEYTSRIKTFWNTGEALKQARISKIPILFTNGMYGDKITDTPTIPGKISASTLPTDRIASQDDMCAEVILKVNPEYKVWDPVPVYFIPDMRWAAEYMKQLPAGIKSAIVCDGIHFIKLNR